MEDDREEKPDDVSKEEFKFKPVSSCSLQFPDSHLRGVVLA